MLRRLHAAAAGVAAILLTGCEFADCIATVSPGIYATIVDGATGQPPTVPVLMRIEDGTYVEEVRETARSGTSSRYEGAYARAGTYRVTVTASGYQEFRANNIRVRRQGDCGNLVGGELQIALMRLPALSAER